MPQVRSSDIRQAYVRIELVTALLLLTACGGESRQPGALRSRPFVSCAERSFCRDKGDGCVLPPAWRSNQIRPCTSGSELGIDANSTTMNWTEFEGATVKVSGRLHAERGGWLKSAEGGREFYGLRIGPTLRLRTDAIECIATLDCCDAEGFELTVEGRILTRGAEGATFPTLVPTAVCYHADSVLAGSR